MLYLARLMKIESELNRFDQFFFLFFFNRVRILQQVEEIRGTRETHLRSLSWWMTDLRFLGDTQYLHSSRDFPFHLNGRHFCFPFSFYSPSIHVPLSTSPLLPFLPSLSFCRFSYPWTVVPKSSSKYNNRVWRGSGVQQRRCWKVWLARWMERLVPRETRRGRLLFVVDIPLMFSLECRRRWTPPEIF